MDHAINSSSILMCVACVWSSRLEKVHLVKLSQQGFSKEPRVIRCPVPMDFYGYKVLNSPRPLGKISA